MYDKHADNINIKKLPGAILAAFLLFFVFSPLSARANDVVVVIDPGHGGDNHGAMYGDYVEKEMNLIVARAMQAELLKYEGISVYLTREDSDTDISLRERAEFAAEKGADFLFCLHFNMSEDASLYGTEVWVSAFDEFYAQGHAFAQIHLAAQRAKGLFDRGIKTRLNDGGIDYYGIIRHSRDLGMASALIEYCHLDHIHDQPFYALGDFQLEQFGRESATAVAQYFKLSSAILANDFSDFPVPYVPLPDGVVRPDITPPDVAQIELISLDEAERIATFSLLAEDHDSHILYYGLSHDGGDTFDILEPFPPGMREIEIKVAPSAERDLDVAVLVLNAYDRKTLSNIVRLAALPEVVEAESSLADDAFEDDSVEAAQDIAEEAAYLTVPKLWPADIREQMLILQEADKWLLIAIGVLALFVLTVMVSQIVRLPGKKQAAEQGYTDADTDVDVDDYDFDEDYDYEDDYDYEEKDMF